jgi:hypothetical protein
MALVRRRTQRIGAWRLFPAFQIFEKREETLERFELMGVHRQKMAGAVFQPIVPGEQCERRGVRRLDDDVGDHHLQFFDSYGGGSRGQRAAYHGFGIVALTRARR